jgi:hypothetical protein
MSNEIAIKLIKYSTIVIIRWIPPSLFDIHSHCEVMKLDIIHKILYILESNPHLVFATFLNEKKLVRASNPHLSFNRPLPTGRLFE